MDNRIGGSGGQEATGANSLQQSQLSGNVTEQNPQDQQQQQGTGGMSLAFQQLQRSIANANGPHVSIVPGVAAVNPFSQQPQGTVMNGSYTAQQMQQVCSSSGMQHAEQQQRDMMRGQSSSGMDMNHQYQIHHPQQHHMGSALSQQQFSGGMGIQTSSDMGMQLHQRGDGNFQQQQQQQQRQFFGVGGGQACSSVPQQHQAGVGMPQHQVPHVGDMGNQPSSSMVMQQQPMSSAMQNAGIMGIQTSSGMLQPLSGPVLSQQQRQLYGHAMGGQINSDMAMQQQQQPTSSMPHHVEDMSNRTSSWLSVQHQPIGSSMFPQQQQQQHQAQYAEGLGGPTNSNMAMQQMHPSSSMPQNIWGISSETSTSMAMHQQQPIIGTSQHIGGMSSCMTSSIAMQQQHQQQQQLPMTSMPQHARESGGQTSSGTLFQQQPLSSMPLQQPHADIGGQMSTGMSLQQQPISSMPQQHPQVGVSQTRGSPSVEMQHQQQHISGMRRTEQQQQQQPMAGMPPVSGAGAATHSVTEFQQEFDRLAKSGSFGTVHVAQGNEQSNLGSGGTLNHQATTPYEGGTANTAPSSQAPTVGPVQSVATSTPGNSAVVPVANTAMGVPFKTTAAELAAAGAAAAAALPQELTSALQQIAQMQTYIQQQMAPPANLSTMTPSETEAWKARQREAAAMGVILQQRQSAAMAAIIQHNRKVASGTGTPSTPSTSSAPSHVPASKPKPSSVRFPAPSPTPSMGFIPAQLACLRNQILTFKRIKRGDKMTVSEVMKAITPPPLKKSNRGRKPKAIMPGPTPIYEAVQAAAATTPKPPGPTAAEIRAAQKAAAQKAAADRAAERAAAKAAAAKEAAAQKAAAAARAAAQKAAALAAAKAKADALAAAKAREAALVPKQPTVKDHRTLARFLNPLATVANASTEHVSVSPYGALRAVAPDAKPIASVQIDLQALMAKELTRQMAVRKQIRMEQLESALSKPPAAGPPRPPAPNALPERGRLQLQLRMCRLLERQAALRAAVESEQSEVLDMSDRMYRKYVRTLDRKNLDIAKVADKARQERTAERTRALRSWRSDLSDRASAARELRNARNRGILRAHDRMLRAATKSKEDARSRRMEALKANDFEAYQEMLKSQQGSGPGGEGGGDNWQEISKFLNDTERYLESLGSKLASVKAGQEAAEAAEQAAAEARAAGLGEEEVKMMAAAAAKEATANSRIMKQANNIHGGDAQSRYYSLAHSIEEKVLSKPSMLIPPNNGSLREYQIKGLAWMVSLYNNHLNGILADEMGLGKTVQVMALIAYLMESKGNYGPHLIIVPNAVLVNWKSELQTWLPSVRCVYYVGHRDERARKFASEVMPMQFNVLVTTYEFIMRDRAKLSKVEWKYIIIDEAQRMKDRSSKLAKDLDRYTAARRLLLTGTPLQNELAELWSLLNLLLPDVFDDNKGFTEWFSGSILSAEEGGAGGEEELLEKEKRVVVIHRLHQILEPFMLRRQVADVETKLPPKIVHTIKCAMTPFQQCIYNWVKATGTKRIDPLAKQGKILREYAPLNNRVMELRKVCNHPLLSYPPLDLHPVDLVRKCGKMMVLDRILVKLFHTPHRVLLFSTMTKLLDVMENYLRWRQVDGPRGKRLMKFARIDGSTALEDREAAIQEFRRPDSETFIFLLSIRAAGRGLNLQTSDTVIIYDPDHNPKNEEQAIARSHRIGQTKEVQVMFMESVPEAPPEAIAAARPQQSGGTSSAAPEKLYADSIESLIRNTIQKMKIDMANEVIDAGRFDGQTTNEERKQTLESLLQDEDRSTKAKNEVPDFSALNRMLGRNQQEVELFDRLDRELEWPEPEGEDAIPSWLGYSPEELNRVALENRPSAFGLDARADRAAKAAAEAEAALGYGRGQRHLEASAKAGEPDTYSWEKEVGAAGDEEAEETGDKVLQQEDSRGHTWDTPNQQVSGRVEETSEVAGPAMKRIRSEAAVDWPAEARPVTASDEVAVLPPAPQEQEQQQQEQMGPTEGHEKQHREKGHHHHHKHHKHKKEKKEKDEKREKRHKRKHHYATGDDGARAKRHHQNDTPELVAEEKPPSSAPPKLKIKLVSKKPT